MHEKCISGQTRIRESNLEGKEKVATKLDEFVKT